ncbi:MAG: acyltransferase [Vicinamibacteria bacterium]|nr:acyltransferase [Vicinamibacteria bacterium]
MSALESMKDVGIQAAVADRRSASEKYRDLVVGSRDFFRLVHFEFVVLFTSWVPGALGLLLRKIFYPTLLGSCGRGVVFGQGVTLRHPHKIHIGEGTVIDDGVLLDAKGVANQGIRIGERGFIGRNTILSCKDGDIVLGSHINIGFNCEVFSSSRVEVGDYGLFAAYTYVVGGGHDHSDLGAVMIDQPRPSKGVTIGRNVWLGAGAKVLDGVTLGSNVVVGAGAVVNESLPDSVIAAGVPAKIIKRREDVSAERQA